jgi:hypothetical protein
MFVIGFRLYGQAGQSLRLIFSLKYQLTAIILKSFFVIWQMISFFVEAPLHHY